MATTVTDVRNPDNAHAWGDDESDVWLGRRTLGDDLTLPRTSQALTAFAEKHLPLGWLSDDGVPIETDTNVEDFYGYQGGQKIKSKVTQTTRTFTVVALEEIVRVTELYWNHGKPQLVAAGEALVDLPGSLKTIDAWAILKFQDGDFWKIYVFPTVQITDRDSLDHKNDSLTGYSMTCTINGDGWVITNSPDFVKNAAAKGEPGAQDGIAVARVNGIDTGDLQQNGQVNAGEGKAQDGIVSA